MASQDKLDTELRTACARNNFTEVTTLLRVGANPYTLDDNGRNILHTTAFSNKVDLLKILLASDKVKNVDSRGGDRNQTALMWACYHGSLECAKILVAHGANPTLRDSIGMDCVHYSACWKNPDMIRECLKWKGVNMNSETNSKMTPLMEACFKGNVEVVRCLLNSRAKLIWHDNNNLSLLYYAKNSDVVRLIVQKRPELAKEIKNIEVVQNVMGREFPDFTIGKMASIMGAIQKSGFNFKTGNATDLKYMKETDFGDILKPMEARKLVDAFTNRLYYGSGMGSF